LSKNDKAVKIRDLDSRNGTFLNGKRIKEAAVTAGDYIGIGSLTFLLQVNGKPEEIVRPKQVEQKPTPTAASQKPAQALESPTDLPSGSFPELDLSDSFMAEIEGL